MILYFPASLINSPFKELGIRIRFRAEENKLKTREENPNSPSPQRFSKIATALLYSFYNPHSSIAPDSKLGFLFCISNSFRIINYATVVQFNSKFDSSSNQKQREREREREDLMACVYIPVQNSEEEVRVVLDQLPRDASDILDILKAEQAPLDLWLIIAVSSLLFFSNIH